MPLPTPMNRLLRTLLGATLVCGATASPAQSIQALYDAARSYDAIYLAARAQYDSAQYRRDQAKALLRPNVGLTASTTRSGSDTPVSDSHATNTQAAVRATQPLFNRSNRVTVEQAERAYAIAATDIEAAEQDLVIRLTTAYLNVLAAQDTLGTAQANTKAISEQLASAKRNFEVGTATITDTREAQARFDLATAQEIVAANDLRSARIALDQLVGRQDVEPQRLAVPVQLPTLEPANVEAWVARTGEAPTIRRARLTYDIAELETDKARSAHLPTVDLVGSFGKQRNDGVVGVSSGASSLAGSFTNRSVGVQMNLPLFTGDSIQNRVRETLALQDKARNDADAAQRGVERGTRQAFFAVQSGEAQVRALEAAEASSKLALEATQLGFKVGVRVNLDVLNAQSQLFTTQRDLARARYNVVLGNLQLRQVAGTLKPEDVGSVNALLAR
ncbi:TolC family outer membrane protein [Methylibium sp.]|uniref:TolC family outer membrane protein n=1 Tax=Methylibium sp. TaxID=2067992 RepID=UPI00286D49E4|nr:TolC family outer membrane protein [Methylibium sp.]